MTSDDPQPDDRPGQPGFALRRLASRADQALLDFVAVASEYLGEADMQAINQVGTVLGNVIATSTDGSTP